MNVVEGNESIAVEVLEQEGVLRQVHLTRTKVRGNKTPEKVVLHFNMKTLKFTSWPKRWGALTRTSLQSWLVDHLEERREAS